MLRPVGTVCGRSNRRALAVVVVAAAALLAPASALAIAEIDESQRGLPDIDTRVGAIDPTDAQRAVVTGMGAQVTWNRFGTPQTLIKPGASLAGGLSGADAETVARNWISTNKALFRLSDAGVSNLELLNVSRIRDGSAVLFRQRFGTLTAVQDGLITVAVMPSGSTWKVVFASSSSAGDGAAPGGATLTPQTAWLAAAANVGKPAALPELRNVRTDADWTVFDVPGFSHPQRARLRAFPLLTGSVRAVFETNVLDVTAGIPTAYTVLVDAQTGVILHRVNRTQQAGSAGSRAAAPQTSFFSGTYSDNPPGPVACGPYHGPYLAPPGTKSIDVVAAAAVETNDIVLELHFGQNNVVASSDTATSPEVIHYIGAGGVVPPGSYYVRVCPYDRPSAPPVPPYNYAGNITINDVAGTQTFNYPPRWKVFPANPSLAIINPGPTIDFANDDTRKIWCWNTLAYGDPPPANCNLDVANLAGRVPWDHDVQSNLPTFTTRGNNAISGEAWGSPLTPAEPYRPVSTTREYYEASPTIQPWTDLWNTSKCSNQTVYAPPQRNDIDAATINMFVQHNRMHDWSYFLGFNEQNYNMQQNNFGNTPPGPFPAGRENDPEVGQSQAAAISGAPPGYGGGFGRDNANQITLQDGIPGITNMYLWQPWAVAFYPPCVDGDYDMSVIGHEYTHAISNRMVGGPDSGLTGPQAGAMGESWSDLIGVEYLREYQFNPTNDEHPFAVGPYATGHKQRGIRNYNMSNSPLNYSDVGYDLQAGGPQVHADGEIWSATNYTLRGLLVQVYGAGNADVQRQCADGQLPPQNCPGNRRWVQIVFDAFLLMPSAASMVDARNAYLAADFMRFGGANQAHIWRAFALRGLGQNAASNTNADPDPVPSFESPLDPNEATVTFAAAAPDEGNAPVNSAVVYVGHYESGAMPVADTNPSSDLPATVKLVGGHYQFLVRAPGYGFVRFARTFTPGATETVTVSMPTNWASSTKGGVAAGDGANKDKLIDDRETLTTTAGAPAPNGYWRCAPSTVPACPAPIDGKQVTVALGGAVPRTVTRVQVSAHVPGRFRALRQFEIHACTAGPSNVANPTCDGARPAVGGVIPGFTKLDKAPMVFRGVAPRPVAPDLILRSWDVTPTNATHVMLRVRSNQCTAQAPDFQGNQDSDPLSMEDCDTGSSGGGALTNGPETATDVRAAEFQVFSSGSGVSAPNDPLVTITKTGPLTASTGSNVAYTINYTNLGPFASQGARVTDVLPAGVSFVSATSGGTYDAATRRVTWALGTVNADGSGSLGLTVNVTGTVGSVIINAAKFTGEATVSPPTGIAVTTVVP